MCSPSDLVIMWENESIWPGHGLNLLYARACQPIMIMIFGYRPSPPLVGFGQSCGGRRRPREQMVGRAIKPPYHKLQRRHTCLRNHSPRHHRQNTSRTYLLTFLLTYLAC